MHYCENLEVEVLVNFIQLQAGIGHNFPHRALWPAKEITPRLKEDGYLYYTMPTPPPPSGFQAPNNVNPFLGPPVLCCCI